MSDRARHAALEHADGLGAEDDAEPARREARHVAHDDGRLADVRARTASARSMVASLVADARARSRAAPSPAAG